MFDNSGAATIDAYLREAPCLADQSCRFMGKLDFSHKAVKIVQWEKVNGILYIQIRP